MELERCASEFSPTAQRLVIYIGREAKEPWTTLVINVATLYEVIYHKVGQVEIEKAGAGYTMWQRESATVDLRGYLFPADIDIMIGLGCTNLYSTASSLPVAWS